MAKDKLKIIIGANFILLVAATITHFMGYTSAGAVIIIGILFIGFVLAGNIKHEKNKNESNV